MKILRPTMAALSASIIATGIGLSRCQRAVRPALCRLRPAPRRPSSSMRHIPDNYRINYEYLGS